MSDKECHRGRIPARSISLGLVAVLVTGCTDKVTQIGPEDIVQLRLSVDSAQVATGRTLQLHAFPLDETGGFLVGQDVTWSSRDGAVATVDDAGLVTGIAVGTVNVLATAAGSTDSTVVTVVLPPVVVLSDASVGFTASAGGADPTPDTVDITNGGTAPLVGLAVDSVVYGANATGWLAAALDQADAPAELELRAMAGGITTAGTYAATVWISATDAEQSPATVQVTFDVSAGAPATMTPSDGDEQTADAGTAVATAPSVLVEDQFGNPAEGLAVTFSVTGGGGSVTGGTATVDASGVARVGSWTLGTTAGPNELTATLGALTPVRFSASGVPGPATKLVISAGNNQGAVAGSTVAVPPAVKVSDDYDNGVSGVAVTFGVTSGGGSVTGASQTTSVAGVATVGSWTLGTVAGPNQLSATATGFASPVTFDATGISGTPTAIQLVGGDAQADTVAATLAATYAVKVVDSNGNGVQGITVNWGAAGGGSFTSMTNTDATGVATAVRILGTMPGTYTDTAKASVGSVYFTPTVTVGSADEIRVTAGAGQSATVNTAVGTAPQVIVVDKFNNPISGHSVTFSVTAGGGSVDPTTAIVTDTNGHATLSSWTLGTVSGTNNNTISALAGGSGVAGNPVSISATATADAPTSFQIVAGNGQTAITDNAVATSPAVILRDQFNNPVPGITVSFSASGGGSVGTGSLSTNANGQASTAWTVSVTGHTMGADGTYQNTLTASSSGFTSLQFTGYARYSFPTHVNPIFANSPAGCTGCHTGATPPRGLLLDGPTASDNYSRLYNVDAGCDAAKRVSPVGTTSGLANSVLFWLVDPSTANGVCWATHPELSGTDLTIMEAWIRNGAPNN